MQALTRKVVVVAVALLVAVVGYIAVQVVRSAKMVDQARAALGRQEWCAAYRLAASARATAPRQNDAAVVMANAVEAMAHAQARADVARFESLHQLAPPANPPAPLGASEDLSSCLADHADEVETVALVGMERALMGRLLVERAGRRGQAGDTAGMMRYLIMARTAGHQLPAEGLAPLVASFLRDVALVLTSGESSQAAAMLNILTESLQLGLPLPADFGATLLPSLITALLQRLAAGQPGQAFRLGQLLQAAIPAQYLDVGITTALQRLRAACLACGVRYAVTSDTGYNYVAQQLWEQQLLGILQARDLVVLPSGSTELTGYRLEHRVTVSLGKPARYRGFGTLHGVSAHITATLLDDDDAALAVIVGQADQSTPSTLSFTEISSDSEADMLQRAQQGIIEQAVTAARADFLASFAASFPVRDIMERCGAGL